MMMLLKKWSKKFPLTKIMLKEDFIKFADQGNSRVSVNKVIQNFKENPLQARY